MTTIRPTTTQSTTVVEPAEAHADDLLVGVDVGGTKIAVLVTSPDGTVLGRAIHASSVADQDGAAEAIAACIDNALADPRPLHAQPRRSVKSTARDLAVALNQLERWLDRASGDIPAT